MQCAENKDGRKISYHIISRLGTLASKRGVYVAQKFNSLHKWPNLQGTMELIWRSFFACLPSPQASKKIFVLKSSKSCYGK